MSTLIRSKWVSGLLEFFGVTAGTTVLKITETGIEANVTGDVTGNVAGMLTGGVIGFATLEKGADYALVAAEKAKLVISAKMTVENKVLILGLAAGQVAFVYNHGTITFKVKNVAGDTGNDLATGKIILMTGSTTANASTVIALN